MCVLMGLVVGPCASVCAHGLSDACLVVPMEYASIQTHGTVMDTCHDMHAGLVGCLPWHIPMPWACVVGICGLSIVVLGY